MGFYDLTSLRTLAAGAVFGGALTAAGVYHPSVILGQMNLEDFHMLKVFLTATATSAIVIPIANYFKFSDTKPRSASSIGWFHRYDANITGGALLGVGMALTGACPGTVLPQIVTGVRSGLLVGVGGILGAILYTKTNREVDSGDKSPTVYSEYGINQELAILGYEVACGTIVAGAMHFDPNHPSSLVPPVVGGLMVGASQAASLVLVGRTLGVSAAYEQVARSLMWLFSDRRSPQPEAKSTVFVGGAMLGSLILSQAVVLPAAPDVDIGALRSLVGGAMLIYGARLAQGCTSGHGISGMSQLSVSSFISVAAMFGGGFFAAFIDRLITI